MRQGLFSTYTDLLWDSSGVGGYWGTGSFLRSRQHLYSNLVDAVYPPLPTDRVFVFFAGLSLLIVMLSLAMPRGPVTF